MWDWDQIWSRFAGVDWNVVLNVLAALAAIATVMGVVFQSRRPERAFARYERWARIRDDSTNAWEKTHAEQKRRESLVTFLASSETRKKRRSILVKALLWVGVGIGGMWLSRVAWAGGPPHYSWWVAFGIVLIAPLWGGYASFREYTNAQASYFQALGFDVSPNGTEGGATPVDLAKQLRMVDKGRAIRKFLRGLYPDHPPGAPWLLSKEEVKLVIKQFGPRI